MSDYEVIGTCSICGGEVRAFTGAWMATVPPPPPECSNCGARMVRGPVLPMVPNRRIIGMVGTGDR